MITALLLQVALVRPYWVVSIDSLALGTNKHTHVQTTGLVTYTRVEEDGDLHIRLQAASGRYVIAECIPRLPCRRPRFGETITVKGIYRRDPEHGNWAEIHPTEEISP